MNYSHAFTYVFEDKNWLSKILIAGLISLIPIVGQFYLFGWMVEVVRRTKARRTDILPTTHFSYFLTLGLKLFVVCLIYSIPVIILSCIIGAINSTVEINDNNTAITIIYTGMGCFGSLLTFVVQIAVALIGTYGTIKLAETDQIKACLDFKDAYYTIKSNLSAFIIVELLMLVAGIIESVGLVLCLVGVIFTAPYGVAVCGNLTGQLWDNLKKAQFNEEKPYRGSLKEEEDIIEEAPFTKVQEIEKEIPAELDDEPETNENNPTETEGTVSDPEEATITEASDETVTETVAETVETIADEPANPAAETDEKTAEVTENDSESKEDQKTDDSKSDLPSFE